jgi:hypothetical protein
MVDKKTGKAAVLISDVVEVGIPKKLFEENFKPEELPLSIKRDMRRRNSSAI